MSRGNQREKAREKNQAATAGKVCSSLSNNVSTSVQADTDHRARRPPYVRSYTSHNDQSSPNNIQLSGSEQAKAKEEAAKIMRDKQLAGQPPPSPYIQLSQSDLQPQPKSAKKRRPRPEARRRSRQLKYPYWFLGVHGPS